jgi:hypothetical protein
VCKKIFISLAYYSAIDVNAVVVGLASLKVGVLHRHQWLPINSKVLISEICAIVLVSFK